LAGQRLTVGYVIIKYEKFELVCVQNAKDIKNFYEKLMGIEKVMAWIVVPTFILAIILCVEGLLNNTWDLETFKILLQFIFIVVIGGAITLIFSQYSKECEKREQKKEEYRKILAEIIKEYNSAKRIRRLLRAEAKIVTGEGIAIKAGPYREQMRALNNVQLRFEYLKRFVENSDYAELKSKKSDSIESYLKSIESYLNRIIKEYENSYPIFSNNGFGLIKNFPYLEEFLKKDENREKFGKDFGRDFKASGESAMKNLHSILNKN